MYIYTCVYIYIYALHVNTLEGALAARSGCVGQRLPSLRRDANETQHNDNSTTTTNHNNDNDDSY